MKKYNFLLLVINLVVASTIQAQLPADVKQQPGNVPKIKAGNMPTLKGVVNSKTITVAPAMVSNFCPWVKTRGDNNFEDNPVAIEVNIFFSGWSSGTDSVLMADISLYGSENGGDGSRVRGHWVKEVYRAPAGWVIKQISNEVNSLSGAFSFTANPAEPFIVKGCKYRYYSMEHHNFGWDVAPPTLKNIEISVHLDKLNDFDEVESTCGCGFKIAKIEFKQLTVKLQTIR
jgi:hypothetical protein